MMAAATCTLLAVLMTAAAAAAPEDCADNTECGWGNSLLARRATNDAGVGAMQKANHHADNIMTSNQKETLLLQLKVENSGVGAKIQKAQKSGDTWQCSQGTPLAGGYASGVITRVDLATCKRNMVGKVFQYLEASQHCEEVYGYTGANGAADWLTCQEASGGTRCKAGIGGTPHGQVLRLFIDACINHFTVDRANGKCFNWIRNTSPWGNTQDHCQEVTGSTDPTNGQAVWMTCCTEPVGQSVAVSGTSVSDVAEQRLYKTHPQHPECPAAFPTLYMYVGNHGDRCRTADGSDRSRSCPFACAATKDDMSPFCLNSGTRDACRDTHCNQGGYHKTIFTTSDERIGNYCTGTSTPYAPPRGCKFISAAPWIVKTSETWKPCRVGYGSTVARGYWNLVATNTHGAEVTLEVGISNSTGKEATKEQSKELMVEVSHSFGVEYESGPVTVSGERSFTAGRTWESTVAETMESVIENSKTSSITVECPDATNGTNHNEGKHTSFENSASLEYVYQWMLSGSTGTLAKTHHFRCHQVGDGIERMPQCSPLTCGSPALNPYCQYFSSDSTGADPRCTTPLTPG